MDSLITPDTLDRFDEIQIKPITRLDIFKDPVPVYNDNARVGNMVYSSTLAILKGSKMTLEPILKSVVDNSIQFVILCMSDDKKSDLYNIRRASMKIGENNSILLPSVCLSLKEYKYLYSSPYNNSRYQQYVSDKGRNVLSFLSIPMVYYCSLRYYCTNWDVALRFEENLCLNGIDAMPREGFYYEVMGVEDKNMFLHGTMQITTENKAHQFSKLTHQDKQGDILSSTWCVDIPITIRASIISRPYYIPSVLSPTVNINMNGQHYESFSVLA